MTLLIVTLVIFGLIGIVFKRTLLSTFVGMQLIVMSLTSTFVFLGVQHQEKTQTSVLALIIICVGGVQSVIGCGFLSRVFYQRKRCDWSQVKNLKG